MKGVGHFDPEDSYEQYTVRETLPWFSVDSPKGGQAGKDEKISEVARFLLFVFLATWSKIPPGDTSPTAWTSRFRLTCIWGGRSHQNSNFLHTYTGMGGAW